MDIIEKININKFEINYENQYIIFPKISWIRDEFPLRIIGKNGCGKTSFILSLIGAIPEDICGKPDLDIEIFTEKGLTKFPYSHNLVRVIPQSLNYGLLGFYPTEEIEIVSSPLNNWYQEVFKICEIEKLPKISSMSLSDGEKKRITICKTLCANPSLIVSDEWRTHLDEIWIQKFEHLFEKYSFRGGLHMDFMSKGKNNGENVYTLETKRMNANVENEINEDFSIFINKICSKLSQEIKYFRYNAKYYNGERNNYIQLEIRGGELLMIIGRNGTGKTSLLKNLWKESYYRYKRLFSSNKMLPDILFIPTNPTYHIIGPNIKQECERTLRHDRSELASEFFCKLFGSNENQDVFELSFGQQKIFAIALGLFGDYQMYCIDEPFAGLDSYNYKVVINLLDASLRAGKSIIIADQKDNIGLNSKIYQI